MENKVRQYILTRHLLEKNESVLIGLSGGADSVALALVLKELGYPLTAVHCNFHLRGEDSDNDERFVRQFCQTQDLPLYVQHFQTSDYAKEKKISIEMAARDLRYAYFRNLMKSEGISTLAVAHHQNDQAETLLINLIRGTGIHGLRGMLPRNGDVVRPLLCVNKEEILAYLHKKGQDFVTDQSNLSTDYTRNKIRLELIPYLQKLNPSLISSLNQTARHLSEAEWLYNKKISELMEEFILSPNYTLGVTPILVRKPDLTMESAEIKPLWHEILSPYGFTDSQVENILNLQADNSGRVFFAPDWELITDRNTLVVKAKEEGNEESIIINNTDNYISINKASLNISIIDRNDYPELERDAHIALLNLDKLQFPLQVRKVHTGDYFVPLGMKGKKLVSNFLTDSKVSAWEKKEQLVLCNNTGEILWVIGRRISARYALNAETKHIYRIKYHLEKTNNLIY